MKLEDVKFHEDCHKLSCGQCLAADSALNERLEELIDSSRLDLPGLYHQWMRKAGKEPETDGGWWSKAALDPENVRAFADYMNE